jgi:hypothetical protein
LSQASDREHRGKEDPMGHTQDVVVSDPGSVVEAGSAAEAERLVGTIEELWRYPVKSMLGGSVSELLVAERVPWGIAPGRCATRGTGGS